LPTKENSVAIDVGIESFATMSSGETIINPRFLKNSEKALAKAQRKKDKLAKGTPERRKQAKVVA
jgi:putative transposase